ncbi:MAG TPA: GGDEF domain-containing protein [Methylibium sp.]|uniref:GGDEF domain-containing protein n=1 Tax=Methylibium sp. TaxID=2067992 RepID=UPI002DB7867B|nr:GGDEF domain-containing protein [Methylibium sp.]HEU4458537.1 GGDEF domain-containing protein [Methylibium sp.]
MTALLDTDRLRLDAALQLLQRAGHTLAAGPRDAAWLQHVIDALCDLSSRDALTGLANRRQFDLALEREVDRVARAGEPALVLLLDLDHFKSINDRHGHPAGDLVLQTVARTLAHSVRPMDIVARYGGEEFAIVMPNCPPAFAAGAAERIRRAVEALEIAVAPELVLRVTASLGGAFAPPWVRSSASLWTARADEQLYRAKREGRNRSRLEPAVSMQVSAEERQFLFAPSMPVSLDEPPPEPHEVRSKP